MLYTVTCTHTAHVPHATPQVLTPTKQAEVGTHALNPRLQQLLNPPAGDKPQTTVRRAFAGGGEELTWRVGDRVVQTKNNYESEVFNGAQV